MEPPGTGRTSSRPRTGCCLRNEPDKSLSILATKQVPIAANGVGRSSSEIDRVTSACSPPSLPGADHSYCKVGLAIASCLARLEEKRAESRDVSRLTQALEHLWTGADSRPHRLP